MTTSNKNTLLNRESGSGKQIIDKSRDANYLFDPRGGVFVWDARFRREYFKYRYVIMKSLWDIATKTKKDYIIEAYTKLPWNM